MASMESPKRWFHVSQDINGDPEFDALEALTGSKGIRIWLEIGAMIDKSHNALKTHDDLEGLGRKISRKVGTNIKIFWKTFQYLSEKSWISSGKDSENNSILFQRNFLKYRGNRYHGNMMDKGGSCRTPSLPFPSLPLEEKKEEKPNPSTSRKKSQGSNTREITKEFLDQLKNNPAYQDLDLDKELGKCEAWMLANNIPGKPSKKRLINWLNKANPTFKGGSSNGKSFGNNQRNFGQGQGTNNGQPRKYDFLREEAAARRAKLSGVDDRGLSQTEHPREISRRNP